METWSINMKQAARKRSNKWLNFFCLCCMSISAYFPSFIFSGYICIRDFQYYAIKLIVSIQH